MSEATAEMVEWLEESNQVDSWKMTRAYKGFAVKTTCFDPSSLPDGWKVRSIFDGEISIGPKE